MSMKEAYQEKLKAQLDQWNVEIDKLKARAEARIEYYEQTENLRAQQAEADAKLQELRQAGEGAWDDLRAGIESAWDSLGKAVRSAGSRFD